MSDGFLQAIDDRQGCNIQLDGQAVYIERARLGEHLQLAALAAKFDEAQSPAQKAAHIEAYFNRLGLDVTGAQPGEVLYAYARLRVLNQWFDVPAWLKDRIQPETEKKRPDHAPKIRPAPYAYKGRFWAFWIHKIASFYHWPRHEIFNLWPEEAAYYIQEILLTEFEDRENQRALSRLSYRVDQNTGMGQFVPTPPPPWMVDEAIPEDVKYKTSMLPVGAVEAQYTSELFKNGKAIDDTEST